MALFQQGIEARGKAGGEREDAVDGRAHVLVDRVGIGAVVEHGLLDVGQRIGKLAAGFEKEDASSAEALLNVAAVVGAHRNHQMGFLQQLRRQGASLMPADIETLGEQVVAYVGPYDVREVDGAGGRNMEVAARLQGVPQRVLGGEAAEDVAGADEQHPAAQARTLSRKVTNSSAAVGWMPMVASNCALVAPSFTAMATPWMISPASGPIMCAPTTAWVAWSTTSFMKVRSALSVRLSFSARNEVL